MGPSVPEILCGVFALQRGPTRALEMVSRCLVETGTSCLYTMVSRLCAEPVLTRLTARMKDDEVHHYKHFYNCYLGYRQNEQPTNIGAEKLGSGKTRDVVV